MYPTYFDKKQQFLTFYCAENLNLGRIKIKSSHRGLHILPSSFPFFFPSPPDLHLA